MAASRANDAAKKTNCVRRPRAANANAALAYLAERPGRVCTREELLEAVWGPDYLGTPRTVDQHVLQLREKLGEDPKAPRFLETVRGVGYRFREEA